MPDSVERRTSNSAGMQVMQASEFAGRRTSNYANRKVPNTVDRQAQAD